ncbi:uncharacterized protein LOC122135659 [Cyprinus carpio]|uniref:Uncharacterized protein LOC122135659 n=1 Tax=Cyprinus carpio TaxID=7962 RepID=A0A9Q9VV81_CYPCA|nr:uncharacterized protein LOC122135659 [Cyprinus carpio]
MDEALGEDFDETVSQQVITSEADNDSAPHPSKKLRQIKPPKLDLVKRGRQKGKQTTQNSLAGYHEIQTSKRKTASRKGARRPGQRKALLEREKGPCQSGKSRSSAGQSPVNSRRTVCLSAPLFCFRVSHKDTEALIRWRMGHGYLFSGWRNTCRNGWEYCVFLFLGCFIQETKSNLDGNITSQRAKRKWENLKCKYKVLKALAKDVETVKPESWRWFRLMEKAVDGDPTDADPPKPTLLTNLADESECAAQPSKKMYQVEMGSDILELLTHSVIEVNTQATVADEGPSSDTAESVKGRSIKKSPPETQDELHFERAKLRRERQLLEKEHADLDRERVLLEREKAHRRGREKTALERDRAQLVKDRAAIDRERASLEQDRARLEGDRAALERDRETFTAMALDTNSTGHTEPDSPFAEDRKRLIFLFEKLIERF